MAARIIAESASRVYGQRVLEGDDLMQFRDAVAKSPLYARDYAKDASQYAELQQSGPTGIDTTDTDAGTRDVPLCTATQLTFTLPPAPTGLSYFVRYRVLVDQVEKEEWTNPLQQQGGIFFSPKLKGYKATMQLAPPVILERDWEKDHIEPMWRWQSQCHQPDKHTGEARLFTLSGLIPSVTGSRGASWIGGGLYGERTVELQYKLQTPGADWTNPDGWKRIGEYKTPATDVTTMLLALALNWLKAEGVPKIQETFVSEIGTKHRQDNIRALRHFVAEAKEKLEPFYLAQVVPFLENSKVLQFVLPEKQDEWLRRVVLSMMQTLQQHQLISRIPQKFQRDAPKIKLLMVSVAGKPLQELAMDKLGVEWVEVPEGEDFTIQIVAERSAVGQQKPRAMTMMESQEQDFGMRIWFLAQESGDSGIRFQKLVRDGDDPEKFVVFGQKLRRRTLKLNDAVEGSVSCELPIRGRHEKPYDYALLERGTELSIRVVCEEHWSYESDHVCIRVRIMDPTVQRAEPLADLELELERTSSLESAGGVSTAGDVRARHIPRRLTAPKVFGNARTEEEVRLTYRKSTHFLNLQPSDLNQSVRSGALNESASFYTPRGRTTAQELFDCTDLHDEDKYELHRKRLVNMVLIELGHTPADDDLEYCLRRLQDRTLDEETFLEYYRESNWAKPMLAEALEQFEATVREKRNDFLLNSVQLPLPQWGFEPTEWGFPATPLWKQHATNLVKQQLHEIWIKQITRLRNGETDAAADAATAEVFGGNSKNDSRVTTPLAREVRNDVEQDLSIEAAVALAAGTASEPAVAQAPGPGVATAATSTDPDATTATATADCPVGPAKDAGSQTAGPETAANGEMLQKLNLQDKDAVRGAPLLQVIEDFSVAMAKHYLSELLPTPMPCGTRSGKSFTQNSAGFDSKKRAEWVEDMVASASMGKACEQVAFYKLAAQHRKWTQEQQQRAASKEAARKKAQQVQAWLADQSRPDTPIDSLPPAGVSISDVAFEMVKEKVKVELQDAILEQVEGACSEAKAQARSYWEQHWASIGCAVASCVILPVVTCGAVAIKVLQM